MKPKDIAARKRLVRRAELELLAVLGASLLTACDAAVPHAVVSKPFAQELAARTAYQLKLMETRGGIHCSRYIDEHPGEFSGSDDFSCFAGHDLYTNANAQSNGESGGGVIGVFVPTCGAKPISPGDHALLGRICATTEGEIYLDPYLVGDNETLKFGLSFQSRSCANGMLIDAAGDETCAEALVKFNALERDACAVKHIGWGD